MKLPPDPDNMNDDRAMWAARCINLMSQLTGCDSEDALGDLMVDLFHWGDRNGIPPEEMLNLFNSKYEMYRQETMPFEKEA